jgi:hypothetical protein
VAGRSLYFADPAAGLESGFIGAHTMTIAPRLRIAAACLLFAGAASALDYPPRKPGLWEMSIQSEDGASKAPAMQTQQCIDAASDKAMRDMSSSTGQQACSKQDMRTEGSRTWSIRSARSAPPPPPRTPSSRAT